MNVSSGAEGVYEYAVSEVAAIERNVVARLEELARTYVITVNDRDIVFASVAAGRESIFRNIQATDLRDELKFVLVQRLLRRYQTHLNQVVATMQQHSQQQADEQLMIQLREHLVQTIHDFGQTRNLSPELQQTAIQIVVTGLTGAHLWNNIKRSTYEIGRKFRGIVGHN
jgi:hypothetical protein